MLGACAFLFFMAGAFRYIDETFVDFPVRLSSISGISYCTICLVTIVFLKRNIPNQISRRYMILAVAFLLAWLIVDIGKRTMMPIDSTLMRDSWYLRFVPNLFIPSALIFSARASRLHESQKLHPAWFSIFIISGILMLGVITNDYHQLLYRFPQGLENFYLVFYNGPLYYTIVAWVFLQLVMFTLVLWAENRTEHRHLNTYIILLYMIVGIAYFVWGFRGGIVPDTLHKIYDPSELWTGVFLVCMELCLRTGVLRHNSNFQELFEASTISSSLVDATGGVRYQTSQVFPSSEGQKEQSLRDSLYIDPDHRLHGSEITGGYAFWVDDLSSLNAVGREYQELQAKLEEDNNLIKAENEMIARRAKADEQNKLYDILAKNTGSQISHIEKLIHSAPVDSPDFKRALAEACIYKVYVKRFSNLMLLAQKDRNLNAFELESSLRESLDYLALNNVKCEIVSTAKGTYPAAKVIEAYTLYENIVEYFVGTIEQISINLSDDVAGPHMLVILRSSKASVKLNPSPIETNIINFLGGVVEIEIRGDQKDLFVVDLKYNEMGDDLNSQLTEIDELLMGGGK